MSPRRPNATAGHEGEDLRERRSHDRRPRDKRGPDRKRARPGFDRPTQKGKMSERPLWQDRRPPRAQDRLRKDRPGLLIASSVAVRLALRSGRCRRSRSNFLPRVSAFENVVAQIKSGSVAYSLFALARPFFGESDASRCSIGRAARVAALSIGRKRRLSVDRQFLERNAFRIAQADFYKVDITRWSRSKETLPTSRGAG